MPGTLMYFDIGGRAEAIRALLGHARFQYEDKRLSFEEFGAKKQSGELPLGSAPVWVEDGFTMCQSSAVLRMLGIRLGYYTDDPMCAWNIDSIVDFVEDNRGAHDTFFAPVLGGGAPDESGSDAFVNGCFGKICPVIERRLAAHGKTFIAGTDRPTIADFKTFQLHMSTLDPQGSANIVSPAVHAKVNAVIDRHPAYKRWMMAMKNKLTDYIASRPPRPF